MVCLMGTRFLMRTVRDFERCGKIEHLKEQKYLIYTQSTINKIEKIEMGRK